MSTRKAVEHLHLFLADTEGQSNADVTRELREAGVDVDGFIRDIKAIVAQNRQAPGRRGSRLGMFAHKTREEILKLLEEIQAGTLGDIPGAALSRLEGEDVQNLSEQQLKDLLEGLDAQSGETPEK